MSATRSPEQVLSEDFGVQIPAATGTPGGNFLPFRRLGETVYISGRVPEVLHKGEAASGWCIDLEKMKAKGLVPDSDEAIDEKFGMICGVVHDIDSSSSDDPRKRFVSVANAQVAARLCAIQVLKNAKLACPNGDLSKVKAVLQLQGFVNGAGNGIGFLGGSEEDLAKPFSQQPKVVNGASDLMIEVLGREVGSHSRFAVGAAGLPCNCSVEVAAVLAIAES